MHTQRTRYATGNVNEIKFTENDKCYDDRGGILYNHRHAQTYIQTGACNSFGLFLTCGPSLKKYKYSVNNNLRINIIFFLPNIQIRK